MAREPGPEAVRGGFKDRWNHLVSNPADAGKLTSSKIPSPASGQALARDEGVGERIADALFAMAKKALET